MSLLSAEIPCENLTIYCDQKQEKLGLNHLRLFWHADQKSTSTTYISLVRDGPGLHLNVSTYVMPYHISSLHWQVLLDASGSMSLNIFDE